MTAPSRSQPSIVERINSRIHDAPMPTEHLLDEAAEYIRGLEEALKDSSFMLEAMQKQLQSWGHDPVVYVGGQIDRNDAALSHAGPVARDGERE